MKYLLAKLKPTLVPVLLLSTAALLSACGGSSKKSTPVVDEDPDLIITPDTTAPIITIAGESSLTIFQNTSYIDAGATASDEVDGSVSVSTSGTVNETVIGDYVLTYTSTDAAGNVSTLTRTITVTPVVLTGTAAGGAAIVGTVVVKGALGNTKSALIEADGNYEVDVTGLTAPYRLRAEGTVGGKSYRLHSYVEEASIEETVNITPFTDLIIANTAHQLAEDFFDSNVDTSLDAEELSAQEDALQSKLQNVFDALGLDTAIDLLKTSFSADHSGLDAALDLISIDTDENNIATITNLLDDSSITDDITDANDNDTEIIIDADDLGTAVTDTVAIANVFERFTSAFDNSIPDEADIQDLFGSDFLHHDESLAEFFTDILTDESIIGLEFISVSINDLDSDAGTALVSFSVVFGGIVDPESEQWYVAKDDVLGWQLLGNQLRLDVDDFNYHCNDYDGEDGETGGCGINTSFSDDDLSNNGTDGEPILSATVSIISGDDGTVKDMFYIGTSEYSSEGHIYDEGQQYYSGDWRAFGTDAGQIDPSIFSVGDTIEYNFYEANLDLTDPAAPSVVGDVLFTYSTPVNFEPQTTGKYPLATAATIAAMESFTIDEDFTVAWTLAEGTVIDEVLVQVEDQYGGYVLSVWDEISDMDDTSLTIDSSMFDDELLGNDMFKPDLGYNIIIRIYAHDEITGQAHSTDYRIMVPAIVIIDPPPTLICSYESGWDDTADDGLGAPINSNTFTDFLTVVADCGTPATVTKSDIAGATWLDDGESQTFYSDGLATSASPSTGQFVDGDEVIDFEWYIETIESNTYLVIESDDTIDSDLPVDFWFRETSAITVMSGNLNESGSIYQLVHYSEQSNYSDTDRSSNADAEIWSNSVTQQAPQF